jgi:aromatic ring-opening dioxygenase catalytic subunit (LigB family)
MGFGGTGVQEFDQFLQDACADPAYTSEQREEMLAHWDRAPQARYCHPREEHLLPLQVRTPIAAVSPSVPLEVERS